MIETGTLPNPKPAPERILICPDCYGMVLERRCTRMTVVGIGIFQDCPECEVGSPIGEWKEGTHS